ncbi:recombinase family protein [Erysipelothrix rhusiopathiae]|uniref:recombinase family protein n=1 Tax=Erysipelothrix rhusiopathiae TaxID=1648 RepID=UPI001EE11755|nr:recombinase family protein [Erysipelothrix rhusiopathiae]MCG4437292.1 recombinase family protein [Erysipelothrix rhusiopathiae]
MIQRIKEKENSIAIYVRVSTDEQAKNGFSIRDQRIKLEKVIMKSQIGGVHNTRYYIDEGYTGTNMDRPAFKRLISDIKKGKTNLVMAVDAERIGKENEYNGFGLSSSRHICVSSIFTKINQWIFILILEFFSIK